MKITRADVEHVARLARLRFDERELERFTGQLNDILAYMEQLNEVDTSDIEPTFHAMDLYNVFREDRVSGSIGPEKALSNAPRKAGGAFAVPRVIE